METVLQVEEYIGTIQKSEMRTIFRLYYIDDLPWYIDNATAGSGCTPIITPVLGKILVMKLGISNESQKGQIAFQFAHEYMELLKLIRQCLAILMQTI